MVRPNRSEYTALEVVAVSRIGCGRAVAAVVLLARRGHRIRRVAGLDRQDFGEAISAALADAALRYISADGLLAGLLFLGTAAAVTVTRARAYVCDLVVGDFTSFLGLECLLLGKRGIKCYFFSNSFH